MLEGERGQVKSILKICSAIFNNLRTSLKDVVDKRVCGRQVKHETVLPVQSPVLSQPIPIFIQSFGHEKIQKNIRHKYVMSWENAAFSYDFYMLIL